MTAELLEQLSTAGVGGVEARIIEYLCTHQGKAASVIARDLQIKRTTAYSALENLESRELVIRGWSKTGARFYVLGGDDLAARLNERAIDHLIKSSLAIGKLSRSIPPLAGKSGIEQLKGFEIVQFSSSAQFESALMAYVSKFDHLSIWDPQRAISSPHIERRIEAYLRLSARAKLTVEDIIVAGPRAEWYCSRITNPHHRVVKINSTQQLECEVLALNDRVVFCENSLNAERAFEVRHSGFAQIFKVLYQSLHCAAGVSADSK